ncbi:MAG: tetratricopeptide repeat protein, partial [Gammaproteobacteria bacterium]
MRSAKIIRFNRRLTKPASQRATGVALLLILFGLAGCQAAPPVPYDVLAASIAAGESTTPAALEASFRAAPDHVERLERLAELELQAYAILEDEPLKLGSLGTAMLDNYYGSLTGHYVLARFYQHLENTEAAALHEGWVEQIRAHIKAGARLPETLADGQRRATKARRSAARRSTEQGDASSSDTPLSERGTAPRPSHLTLPYLPATTAVEAQIYALTEGLTPVGSIYQTAGTVPLALLLQGKPENGRITALQFDLSGVYDGIRVSLGAPADDPDFNPFAAVGYLAREGDSAAQTAVGAFLASQQRFDDAVNWLRAASRTGNLIANTLLARIFWEQARATEDDAARESLLDETLDNYLQAITLGSSDAMYALGVLYLNGHFDSENVAAGVPLLRQAADLDNDDALIYLGHLHYTG